MKKEKDLEKGANAPISNDRASEEELTAKAGGMPEKGRNTAETAAIPVRVSDRTAKYYKLYVKADRFFDDLIDNVKKDFGIGDLDHGLYEPWGQVTKTLMRCMIESLQYNLNEGKKGVI